MLISFIVINLYWTTWIYFSVCFFFPLFNIWFLIRTELNLLTDQFDISVELLGLYFIL